MVLEDLDNNGEDAPNESVAERTGVPEKTVQRVKSKIEKKRIEAEEKRAQALQEALQADKRAEELPDVEMTTINVNVSEESTTEGSSAVSVDTAVSSHGAEESAQVSPEVSVEITESVQETQQEESVGEVEVPTSDEEAAASPLSARELAFQKEIEKLQLLLAERDAEIASLRALV